MKPDFALDFRNEAITLLHRQEGGWALVGRVAMDDPDLDAALGYLRATALGLSPRGISAKLILPNDAILYTTLTGLPADRAKRAAMIAQGLVGRTPYRVDDLVYDWTDEGGDAHLAVIARETLVEAEGFATQHRFNPVSFAALPEAGGRFAGEAWFGPTDLAQTLLARGEVVERDSNTAIAPNAPQSAPAQASSSDFEMGAKAEVLQEVPLPAPEPEPAPAPEPEPIAAPSDLPDQAAARVADDEVTPDARAVDVTSIPPAVEADSPATAPVVAQKPADPPPSFDAAMAELDAHDAARMDDEAPMALDVPLIEEDPATAPAKPAPKAIDPDISAKGEGLLAAFAARRNAALTKAELATNTATRKEPLIAPPPTAEPEQEAAAPEIAAAQPPSTPAAAAPKLGPAEAAGSAPKPIFPTLAAPLAAPLTPVRPALLKPEPVVHVPAKAAAAARVQNIKSMPKAKTPPRIKPRIGLGWVLTAALLLSLMAAAAMSSYLMAGFNQLMRGDTQLAAAPNAPDSAQNMALQSPPLQSPTLQNHAALAEAAAAQTAVVARAPQPILSADQTLTLSTRAPSPRPTTPDLPSAAQTAPPLQSPIAPQITVPPSAEETPVLAAANPDELPELSVPAITSPTITVPVITVPVITGAPPIVPAPRPAEIAAPAQPFNADPALASARPAARPSEIPAAILAARAANPPPIANPALASARPAARPTGAMAAALAARQATASASLLAGTQAAVNEALSAPAQDLGPLNVAISRLPSARPAGLAEQAAARLNAAAVAAAAPAASPPVEAEPAAPAETAALEAYEEPEDVTGAAPSRSVVARQATQRNVLVMNDVALVGIFGNQAGRYALVRQPNGRFRKLKVGDRFDGGQVAAITDTELRLAKGGQMVAMQMPRG